VSLFAEEECGPRRPLPIAPPSRRARDEATLNAGIHPASGQRLLPVVAGETKVCRTCRWLYRGPADGYRAPDITRCCVRRNAAGYVEPRRTQLRWPACALYEVAPPPVLEGQVAIPDAVGGAHE
jgi:hypothetical protein